jgi:hypothetical protein
MHSEEFFSGTKFVLHPYSKLSAMELFFLALTALPPPLPEVID